MYCCIVAEMSKTHNREYLTKINKSKNNLALHQFLDTVREDGYFLFCGDRGLMMR